MTHRLRALGALVLALVLVVVLAACDDGGGTADKTTSSPPTTKEGTTKEGTTKEGTTKEGTTKEGTTKEGTTTTQADAGSVSEEFCAAMTTVRPALLVVAAASLGGGVGAGVALLVLSPFLAEQLAAAAEVAPTELQDALRTLVDVFAAGEQQLRELGMSDAAIAAIRELDAESLLGGKLPEAPPGIDKDAFAVAGREFQARLDQATGELADLESAFQSAATDCGPGVGDSCELIDADSVTEAIGPITMTETDDTFGVVGCTWSSGDGERRQALAVQVGTRAGLWDTLAVALREASDDADEIDGVGDEAFVIDGFSSASRGTSRGRTIWVLAAETSFSVAVELADGKDPDDQDLRDLAEQVLKNLS